MLRFVRKNKSFRCSSLVVSKIHAFQGKDGDARAEIDTFMDYCKAVANKGGHTSSNGDDSCLM